MFDLRRDGRAAIATVLKTADAAASMIGICGWCGSTEATGNNCPLCLRYGKAIVAYFERTPAPPGPVPVGFSPQVGQWIKGCWMESVAEGAD